MKKFSLILLSLLAILSASANFTELQYKYYILTSKRGIPVSWRTWTDNLTPSSKTSSFFRKGESYKIGDFSGGASYALSNSSTVEGTQANVGLVTPQIEVPDGHLILTFDAITYLSSTPNTLDVYVSTTGNTEEDFKEENLVATFSVPGNSLSSPLVCNVPLDKFAGKYVYIAFVNHSTNAGLLGINNFLFQYYYVDIENTTPSFVGKEGEQTISLDMKLQVPGTCSGVKVDLSTSTGVKSTFTKDGDMSTLQNISVVFPDKINLKYGDNLTYTATVTPLYEGAKSVSVEGSLICGKGFDGICVEEEGTGEDCAFCPIGAATLNKFSQDYGDRYIGIGVHCGTYSKKVMESPTYAKPYLSYMVQLGGDGFPFAMLNRKYGVTPYPHTETQVKEIINTPSVIGTKINKVKYEPENNNRVTVEFSPELCINMENDSFVAAAVLVADGLRGTLPSEGATEAEIQSYANWAQNATGCKNFTEESVTRDYGAEWWPFLKPYSGQALIIDMVYDHVAMGIWPDFYGAEAPLPTSWTAFVPQPMSISFDMPMQTEFNGFGVQDWTKTAVIVLIMDKNTKEIKTAARMKASDYTVVDSGVNGINQESGYNVYVNGKEIVVNAEAGASVDIYSIDGSHVKSIVMTDNNETISGCEGLLLVRVSKSNKTYYKKLICK